MRLLLTGLPLAALSCLTDDDCSLNGVLCFKKL